MRRRKESQHNQEAILTILKHVAQAAHEHKDYERRNQACRLHDDLVLAMMESRREP